MPAALEGVGHISGYSLRIQITEERHDVFNSIDGCIILFVFNSIDDRLLTFIFEYAGCWTKNWNLYNFLFWFILKIHYGHFNNYLKQNLNNDNMNKYLNKFKQILLTSFPKLNEKLNLFSIYSEDVHVSCLNCTYSDSLTHLFFPFFKPNSK